MKPRITMACAEYDLLDPIREGAVKVEGVDLNYLPLKATEIFARMLKGAEFEVAEMSMSSYLIAREEGSTEMLALPVFPSRSFCQRHLYVRESAGIREPGDLKGRRIGVPEYKHTVAVWVRGLLQHEYGISHREINWVSGKPEKRERAGLSIEEAPAGKELEELLLAGELDALIQPAKPKSLGRGIARLFADYRLVEADYFRRTNIFPLMHTIVLRGDIYARYPWLARSLYKALFQARSRCLEEMNNEGKLKLSIPWLISSMEEEKAILGTNYNAYGLEVNYPVLTTLIQYAYEQGVINRRLEVEELFVPVAWTNERDDTGRSS